MMISEIVWSFLLSLFGVSCPHVQSECVEIYVQGINIATCYGDALKPPITMPCDDVLHLEARIGF